MSRKPMSHWKLNRLKVARSTDCNAILQGSRAILTSTIAATLSVGSVLLAISIGIALFLQKILANQEIGRAGHGSSQKIFVVRVGPYPILVRLVPSSFVA